MNTLTQSWNTSERLLVALDDNVIEDHHQLVELTRHETEAAQDRQEALERKLAMELFEKEWLESQSVPNLVRNKRSTWDGGMASSIPNFGRLGGEREFLTRSLGLRLGDEGTAVSTVVPLRRASSLRKTGERIRPRSMAGNPLASPFNDDIPRSPHMRQSHSSTTIEEPNLTTSELQNIANQLHLARRKTLWKFLDLVDYSLTVERTCSALNAVFSNIITTIESHNQTLSTLVTTEFGFLTSSDLHRQFYTGEGIENPSPRTRHATQPPLSSPFQPIVKRARPVSLPYPSLQTQNFAPHHPNSIFGPQAALNSFQLELNGMKSIVDRLTTKIYSVNAESADTALDWENEERVDQILRLHDSFVEEIRDLESMWRESRILLRGALRKEIKLTRVEKKEKIDGAELTGLAEEEVVQHSSHPLTIFASEEEGVTVERDALVDARIEKLLPPLGLEQIFEATVDAHASSTIVASSTSREERIRAAKERRLVKTSSGKRTSRALEVGMISELKDVLGLLKGRNKLAVE